jgi:hypothetical protein
MFKLVGKFQSTAPKDAVLWSIFRSLGNPAKPIANVDFTEPIDAAFRRRESAALHRRERWLSPMRADLECSR